MLPGTKMKKSRRQENASEGILPALFMLAGRGDAEISRSITVATYSEFSLYTAAEISNIEPDLHVLDEFHRNGRGAAGDFIY